MTWQHDPVTERSSLLHTSASRLIQPTARFNLSTHSSRELLNLV